ncbi:carbohydrate ABC transporter permease [Streptomyces xinghaiensis]|uniref:carbohydrate ABC transporter permease n=1 Tax=Streptomyces xinghaiensis TaxID=1038928 RepID=UPI0002F1515B|nr:carbohydrate ABC transporter permease [Streptomyces xinghaiensis]MZE78983.1 ABC transporter permease subunit [Streptomyces sp. SID5475]
MSATAPLRTATAPPDPPSAPTAPRPDRRGGRPVWEEEPGPAGQGLKGVALVTVCAAILGPLWVVVVTSLSDQKTITEAGGLVIVPKTITFRAYQELLSGGTVTRATVISLLVTLVGTAISMAVSILCAYGLSRPGSLLHRPILMTLLVTMFFSAGLIPTYLLVTGIGLQDSYWAMILPSAVSVFNILVLRAFFMNTAPELIDSARIDGAGEWRILLRIVMPLSKAVIAVISLFYAVGYWSQWFNAMIYLNDAGKWPLQMILRQLVIKQEAPQGMSQMIATQQVPGLAVQMAVMVLALIPVVAVYPFVQKHFTKGMLTGAIKG